VEGSGDLSAPSATMGAVPLLSEPLDRALIRSLRTAVLDYRSGPARSRPTTLHVGEPGGSQERHDLSRAVALDAALRVEVVAALLVRLRDRPGRAREPTTWLARPGELDWQDADRDWLAAATAAYAEADVPLTFVVVGPSGWCDPRSGVRVEWKRLRDRTCRPQG
jgi:hypothetical protein